MGVLGLTLQSWLSIGIFYANGMIWSFIRIADGRRLCRSTTKFSTRLCFYANRQSLALNRYSDKYALIAVSYDTGWSTENETNNLGHRKMRTFCFDMRTVHVGACLFEEIQTPENWVHNCRCMDIKICYEHEETFLKLKKILEFIKM